MDKIKPKVPYKEVNIAQPHFLISYSDEYGVSDWTPIAVLSIAPTVELMHLELLQYGIDDTILSMMHKELNFYLFELNNDNPISYLIYHSSTMANIYAHVHFNYIERITSKNLLYYIKTQSKIAGIYDRSLVEDLQECYVQLITFILFDIALHQDETDLQIDYNKYLNRAYYLLFDKIPTLNNFDLRERCNIVEFASQLSSMEISDFCHVLNYLDYMEIIKGKDVTELLKFFYYNKKQYQDL